MPEQLPEKQMVVQRKSKICAQEAASQLLAKCLALLREKGGILSDTPFSCRWRDLNPHPPNVDMNLNHARMPIPPHLLRCSFERLLIITPEQGNVKKFFQFFEEFFC